MKLKKYLAVFVLVSVFLSFGSFALAEDKTTSVKSKIEMHEKMSDMHKKAADCLMI